MTSSETISSRPILLMVLVLTPASSHKSFFRIFLSIISFNSLLYDTAIFPRLLTFKVVYKLSKNSIAIIAQGALRVNKKRRLLIRRKSCASRAWVLPMLICLLGKNPQFPWRSAPAVLAAHPFRTLCRRFPQKKARCDMRRTNTAPDFFIYHSRAKQYPATLPAHARPVFSVLRPESSARFSVLPATPVSPLWSYDTPHRSFSFVPV